MSGDLANAIARDILAERKPVERFPTCFLCDKTFTPERGAGINKLFCSAICLDAYDAGFMPSSDGNPYDLPKRGDGFLIECAGCRKQFVSRGLRCCSADCDRQHREHQEIEAIVAEVGGELPQKRKCKECGGNIPRYVGVGTKRRLTAKTTRFCSPKCARKARRTANPHKRRKCRSKAPKKPLGDSVPQPAPANPPSVAEGIRGPAQ